MKLTSRVLFVLPLLAIFIRLFIVTNFVQAQVFPECGPNNSGHCTWSQCYNGTVPGNCSLGRHCCADDPQAGTCQANGGSCELVLPGRSCINGSVSGTCITGLTCCAPGVKVVCETDGIDTAIGCIHVGSPQAFAEDLLKWAMGIAGLLAMLFIVYAGFLILTSSGNPKQVAAGRELLTAAISGLFLLLMSAFLLNFIGVRVLALPGF